MVRYGSAFCTCYEVTDVRRLTPIPISRAGLAGMRSDGSSYAWKRLVCNWHRRTRLLYILFDGAGLGLGRNFGDVLSVYTLVLLTHSIGPSSTGM